MEEISRDEGVREGVGQRQRSEETVNAWHAVEKSHPGSADELSGRSRPRVALWIRWALAVAVLALILQFVLYLPWNELLSH